MKKLFFLLILLSVLCRSWAQNSPATTAKQATATPTKKDAAVKVSPVHIVDSNPQYINPIYGDTVIIVPVPIILTKKGPLSTKDTANQVTFTLDDKNSHLKLFNDPSPLKITAKDWNLTSDSAKDIIRTFKTTIYLKNSKTDTLKHTVSAYIGIADDTTHSFKTVTLDGSPTRRGRFLFLNAYSFDFSGSLTSNYFGEFNIWVAPKQRGNNPWGINCGIMKINYNNFDSIATTRTQNVLIKPLDTVKAGTNYYKEFNNSTTKFQNTGWSIYAQPLIRIASNNGNNIYIHAHTELFINKWSATTVVTNIQKVTGTIDATNVNSPFISYLPSTNTFNKTYYNGYFGIGVTFDLTPWKGSSLFLQPTTGITTNNPRPASSTDYNNFIVEKKGSCFYLIRTHFSQEISNATTIVLGTDIRGFISSGFPNPLYAAYVGLNLDIESLAKLL